MITHPRARASIVWALCFSLLAGCANPTDGGDDDDRRNRNDDWGYDGGGGSYVPSSIDDETMDLLTGKSKDGADFDVSSADENEVAGVLSGLLSGLNGGSFPGSGNAALTALIREILLNLKSNSDEPHHLAQALGLLNFLSACVKGFKSAKSKGMPMSEMRRQKITVALCVIAALLFNKGMIRKILATVASDPNTLKGFMQTVLKNAPK